MDPCLGICYVAVWRSAFAGEDEASWLQETRELHLAMVGGGKLVVGGEDGLMHGPTQQFEVCFSPPLFFPFFFFPPFFPFFPFFSLIFFFFSFSLLSFHFSFSFISFLSSCLLFPGAIILTCTKNSCNHVYLIFKTLDYK
jgi:hypothetical protein